jgi:hypothetical protein
MRVSGAVDGCVCVPPRQYTGNPDMGQVHEHMPISEAIYDAFVNTLVRERQCCVLCTLTAVLVWQVGVVTEALSKDVNTLSDDLTAVGSLLYSPGVYGLICNQADCTHNGNANTNIFMPNTCPAPAATTTAATSGSTASTTAAGGSATTTTAGGATGSAGSAGSTGSAGSAGSAGSTASAATPGSNNGNNPPPPAGAASIAISALVALIAAALVL